MSLPGSDALPDPSRVAHVSPCRTERTTAPSEECAPGRSLSRLGPVGERDKRAWGGVRWSACCSLLVSARRGVIDRPRDGGCSYLHAPVVTAPGRRAYRRNEGHLRRAFPGPRIPDDAGGRVGSARRMRRGATSNAQYQTRGRRRTATPPHHSSPSDKRRFGFERGHGVMVASLDQSGWPA
jgi:hypothetical protein